MVMVFTCHVRSIAWCSLGISYRSTRSKTGCGPVGDRSVEFYSSTLKVAIFRLLLAPWKKELCINSNWKQKTFFYTYSDNTIYCLKIIYKMFLKKILTMILSKFHSHNCMCTYYGMLLYHRNQNWRNQYPRKTWLRRKSRRFM